MYILDDKGEKYDIPDNEPSNLELKALRSFAEHQVKDMDCFLSSNLFSGTEKAALTRLARKGWIDRQRSLETGNRIRINPAGWWLYNNFVPDDED